MCFNSNTELEFELLSNAISIYLPGFYVIYVKYTLKHRAL